MIGQFILVPLAAALLVLILNRWISKLAGILTGVTSLYLLGLAFYFIGQRPFNNIIISTRWLFLVLDGLSHLMLVIIYGITFLITLYCLGYLQKYRQVNYFYAQLLLLLAGLGGVVLSADLLVLFAFVEVTALSAYALVAFEGGRTNLEAAVKYYVIGEVASILIIIGLGILYSLTGTFNLAVISRLLASQPSLVKNLALAFFLVGFGTKAALVPFHAWLPDAHSAAPAPISAMLSGLVIKVLGGYALIRIVFNLVGINPMLAQILMVLGAVSLLTGVCLALGQWDFKRLLAYHSISQIGYIFLGLGLGTPLGVMGGLLHLVNHSIFKSLLFLNAGAVEKATGTRDLREMGGLAKKMPWTAGTALVASFSIAGLPPFNGFWSKLFIIFACLQAGRLGLATVAVIGSVLTLASFLKIQKYAFYGKPQAGREKVREPSGLMSFSMVTLASLCLLIGLSLTPILQLIINPAVVAISNGLGYGQMIIGKP